MGTHTPQCSMRVGVGPVIPVWSLDVGFLFIPTRWTRLYCSQRGDSQVQTYPTLL